MGESRECGISHKNIEENTFDVNTLARKCAFVKHFPVSTTVEHILKRVQLLAIYRLFKEFMV